jgi:flagellin
MASVNTNYGALVALQNLTATNKQLDEVQNRINTGLKVGSAKDNGAVFAIAEGLRLRSSALGSVRDGLDRATTSIDTALGAAESVGGILAQLKQKAVDAQTLSSPADRALAQADFAALRDSIDGFVNAATVNGVNLINGTNASNGLNVLTTDIGGAAGGAGAAVQARATTALGAVTAALVAPLTANTQLVGTQGSGVLGATANDTVVLTLADPTGGSNTQQFNIALKAGQTISDYAKGVSEASGGKITVSLDSANNKLVYSSAQTFTVNYTAANSGSLTAATSGAVVNELGQFFGAGTGTIAGTDPNSTITYANGASSTYQTGGGYQLAAGTAQAAGTTTSSKLTDLVNTNDGTGRVTFVVGAQAASQRTFNVSVNGLSTLGDFINAVGQQTNGQVTAAYDSVTRKIIYKATESFTTVANAAAGVKFGPASATAGTAAPTVGSSGGGAGSGATSKVTGFDFRVSGGALSTLSALDLTVDPTAASSTIQAALDTLITAQAKLGGQSKALDSQKTFLVKLGDNIDKGVGLLVDADLAKESARLQALQVKQQLGAQALSIANQAPQILLSFFR